MVDPRTAKTPLFATDGVSWLGLFAGPLAWLMDEQLGYFLAGWSCHAGHRWAGWAVSAGALALALAGAARALHDWRRRREADEADNCAPARAAFLGMGGLLLCLLFGLVVLLDVAGRVAFDPCQR